MKHIFKSNFISKVYNIANEKLHNLDSSPSIIRMMKSKGVKLGGHIASMGRRLMDIGFSW